MSAAQAIKATESKKKKRALQILDAAETLLGEVGYDAMSARDIAERAGVNKALVFYYWGSKAGLFEAVLQRYYDRHRRALEQAFQPGGSLAERVHGVIDAYLTFIENNRLYARLVQQQISGGGPHLDMVRRHLESFFSWTTGALAELAPAQGPQSARQLYMSLSGVVINYFTYAPVLSELWGVDPLSAEALAERRAHVHWLVDCLLRGLDAREQQGGADRGPAAARKQQRPDEASRRNQRRRR